MSRRACPPHHRSTRTKPAVAAFALVLTLAAPGSRSVAADAVVYAETFDARPGTTFPGWSSSPVVSTSRTKPPRTGTSPPQVVANVESPRGGRRFLGEFGGPRVDPSARTRVRQSIRLTLKGLAPHAEATVSFDLLLLRSWDGSSPRYGPDRLAVRVEGGPTLLDATFSNNPKLDSDGSYQDYPRPGSPPGTGSSSSKTLGYGFFGDSVYRLTYTFPHAAETLTVEFASDLFEGKGTEDEAWGLDDVTVKIGPGPGSKPAGGDRRTPPPAPSRKGEMIAPKGRARTGSDPAEPVGLSGEIAHENPITKSDTMLPDTMLP